MGFKAFFQGLQGLRTGKTTQPHPKQEDAFLKASRQSAAELESEFILAVAKAFNDITPKEIKPNLCSFAPPEYSGKVCPARMNVIIGCSRYAKEMLAADTPKKITEPSTSAIQPSRILIRDDFEIIRRIGNGNNGTIFLALDTKTEHFVAVEIIEKCKLDTVSCVRVFEEQHFARSLVDCPWIVGLVGSFEDSMNFYIVSEVASGGSLQRLLGTEGSISLFAKKSIIADTLTALQSLHERSIVYNDLSPSHILFDSNGRVLLANSSISHSLKVTPECRTWETMPSFAKAKHSMLASNVFSQNATPATSGFTAPEVLKGEVPTYQADVFGLGVLVHVLIYGFMPFGIDFTCQTTEEINARIFNTPLDMSDCGFVTPGAQHLIERMLEKDPRERATLEEVKTHRFFRCIDWYNIEARITTDAHKDAVFRYSPPDWVSATQIPSAGESWPTGKSPCPWFEYISASLAMSPLKHHEAVFAEVDLSSFNPQVLPLSNSPMALVNPSKSTTSTLNIASAMVPRSLSTPSLDSSSDNDSYSSSSISSPSTPLTPLELGDTPLPLVDAKPFVSSVAADTKYPGNEDATTVSLRQPVAWWKF